MNPLIFGFSCENFVVFFCKKKIVMLVTSLGQSVLGKTVATVLRTDILDLEYIVSQYGG